MFVTLQVGTLSGITAELLCPEEKRRNMPLVCEGKFLSEGGPADYVSQLPLASWVSFGKRIWKTNFDSLWRAAGSPGKNKGLGGSCEAGNQRYWLLHGGRLGRKALLLELTNDGLGQWWPGQPPCGCRSEAVSLLLLSCYVVSSSL